LKKEIDAKEIAHVSAALMSSKNCKSAVKYIDEKTIVRATWHNKPKANNRSETMVVTIGSPNYKEREFIKKCKKTNNSSFPKIPIQIKSYPIKK
jgi:hypothetical protein